MPQFNESSALLLKTAIDSGITSPAELANIMGNAAVETGNFRRMHEDFSYKTVDRLVSQVRSAERRYTRAEIQIAIDSGDPRQIATIMYEGRDGPGDLGNTEPGDGWRFHGRGYFQYTGRANYTAYGEKFGVDLASNPDIAAEPIMAAKLAIAYWRDKVPEHMRDDPVAAGRRINGGDNGKDARVVSSRQWARIITPELVQDIQSGRTTLEQLATGESQSHSDPVIRALQHNLNTLGIRDAQGNALEPDGNRGGPDSHTNEAIAAFQQRYGIEGRLSNSELLIASQAVLRTRQALDFNRPVIEGAPAPEHAVRMVDGAPDYLVPRQAPADPGTPAPPAPTGRYADGIQPPSASEDALSDGVLQRGESGPRVRALQEQLILLGARDRNGELLRADSRFGDRTKEAVEQFQLWTGRETTGIADPDTLEALREHAQFASRQRAQGVDPSQRHLVDNLKPTAPDLADAADLRTPQERNPIQNPAAFEQGRVIADVQSGLIQLGYQHRTTRPLTVNGVNDEATRQAVTAFQAQNDLPLSGQADQATRQALQEALLRQQQARQEEEAKRREDDPARSASDPLAAPAAQTAQTPGVQHHPGLRDLRQALCDRLERKGQLAGLSDDRLTELAGQMYQAGLRADMRFDATVDGDRFFASASDITHAGKHTSLDLSQPPVSPQETLQAVTRYDRQQAELAAQQPMPDDPSRGRSM